MIPPPTGFQSNLPVLERTVELYKIWHKCLQHLPRLSRFSIGTKIDALFTELIQAILCAGYAQRSQKAILIEKASVTFDTLKFFLRLAWDMKLMDHKKFALLSPPMNEIGKMLGGWRKHAQIETPPNNGKR